MTDDVSDGPRARIAALYVYPIKSCAGVDVDTMRFDALGPLDDRRWMVVDERDEFVTQRELPRLAMVRPALVDGGLRVSAPGMPVLEVAGQGGERRATMVWDDRCAGFDEGAQARAWFSDYLGRPARLLRFDATAPRSASRHWVGDAVGRPGALTRFTDGYPLMLVSQASFATLNARLAQAGRPAAPVQRFRPNVVLDGLDAFEEDRLDTLSTDGASAPATSLRIVRPCARCTIVEVDPRTGRREPGLLEALAAFRADPTLRGAVTFGQNAIVASGLDGRLQVGDVLHGTRRR